MIVSCGDNDGGTHHNPPPADPILERIELSGDYQTTFHVDETFNYEGLVVTAFYDDDSSKVVTPTSVSTPDMSRVHFEDIIVTYLTVSTSYTINIINRDAPKLLRIELGGSYPTVFYQGDEFNTVGLFIMAFYDNGDSNVVSETSISTPDMNKLGKQTVVVTYLTASASYEITILEKEETEEDEYEGYMTLAFYRLDIQLNDGSRHYLNPAIKDKDNKDVDVGDFPFTFEVSKPSLVSVSNAGGIYSKKAMTGSCVVTCIYTENEKITAKCMVNVVEQLPTKEKAYQLVNDYDSLKEGDILVLAAPTYGLTASLDTLHSKLNPVESTFSSDKKTITSLGEGTAEFYLAFEEKGMTLEAQTNEYLKCTHVGKISLDSSTKTNRYWDIHSNIDPETGEGSLSDGAVIENNVDSLGYLMFNVSLRYFTTYVENSLRPGVMELPFIYKLDYIN